MDEVNRELKLLPKQRKFLESTKKEVLYSGGFGSGKSLAICIKAIMEASKKGNVVLILRKTLTSLKKSTLRSLISEDGDNEALLPLGSYKHNKSSGEIQLNNGGIIIYTGLDNPTRILSINAGCILIDEAIEFTEPEYRALFSRLRLNVGSRQILSVTNPGPQSHFLYKRFYLENNKDREVIHAPTTENFLLPKDYIESLESDYKTNELLYKKYILGEWVSAENAVYKLFNREIHCKVKEYESDTYYLGLDFGFTNQTAMVLCQVAGSKVIIKDEVYKTKLLQSDIIENIQNFKNQYPDLTVICDPSAASLIASIQAEHINCLKANNDIALGISRVNTKMAVREDTNEPDLYVYPSCINLIRELENYQYAKDGSEKPVKINDHTCFVGDTLITTDKGYIKIKDINIGDTVLTRFGYKKVIDKACTGIKDVYEYQTEHKSITCTKDHKFWDYKNNCWTEVDKLDYCCIMYLRESINKNIGEDTCQLNQLQSMELLLEDTIMRDIIDHTQDILKKEFSHYIDIYGKKNMEKYQKDIMYTIRMRILIIMISQISKLLKDQNTYRTTQVSQNELYNQESIWILLENMQKNGMEVLKVSNGIKSMDQLNIKEKQKKLLQYVQIVKKNLKNLNMYQKEQVQNKQTCSVQIIASQIIEENLESIILNEFVNVVKYLLLISIQKQNTVQNLALANIESRIINKKYIGKLPVYNITVEDVHEYIANDIVVKNCDALRYVINHLYDQDSTQYHPICINEDDIDF